MRIRHRHLTVWALLAAGMIILYSACVSGKTGAPASVRRIIGVKIYETAPPFEGLFRQWRDLGVNTLLVSETLARNRDFRALAATHGLPLFVIFPVFQSPEAIKDNPGLAAVTAAGTPAREEWVEFVCPSREDFLRRRVDESRSLIADCDPYAVSLDFISPMCYHHMVRQSPAWVHDVVADLSAQTHAAILAGTQVSEAYVEKTLAPGEFGAALEEALKAPSIGVVLWSWDALSQSPEKREILKSSAGLKKNP